MGLFSALANMTYSRFVEIGRVAYVAFGQDEGKLVTIVDVLDQTRALCDGPCSGVGRKIISFKQLHLTPFVLPISHSARTGTVTKAWRKEKIDEKWEETTWAKKLEARKKRANLNDFDRFKLMKAKQTRNRLVNIEFGKLRAVDKKTPKPKRVNKKPTKKVVTKLLCMVDDRE